MKRNFYVCLMAMGLAASLLSPAAAEHYVNGVEGIKASTLPPPGLYYRMYNVFYQADALNDSNGDELKVDFDLKVFANVHRLIWISDFKFMGADYGADIIVPLINTDIKIGAMGVDDSQFGLGDICIEPFLLSWHGALYDAAFGMALYVPSGDYDEKEPASPGKDMWTGMFTLGGTAYFDTEKTWSASVLARYETHSDKGDTDINPGDDFHFEWGIAKTLAQTWDLGMTGYCQWQVTKDGGKGASEDKDSIYAFGPEVNVFIPPATLFVSLRSLWEYGAEDRPEGNITALTLTKIF